MLYSPPPGYSAAPVGRQTNQIIGRPGATQGTPQALGAPGTSSYAVPSSYAPPSSVVTPLGGTPGTPGTASAMVQALMKAGAR